MSLRLLAAGVVAAAQLATATVSLGADLAYPPYGSVRPDDGDDRYGAPPPPRYAGPRYEPSDEDERPAPYLAPMRPGFDSYRRYSRDDGCVPRREIRRSLLDEGWTDFQGLEFAGGIALVQARRPNGDLYELRLDRCSGQIVHARPLERARFAGPDRGYGPPPDMYAWRRREGWRY
jgi:hypothetical protein